MRQFKESNPKYYVPSKFNAFNFTIKKMFDIVDAVLLRLTKKWVAKKMPELKDLPPEEMIKIFISSEKYKEVALALKLE